MTETEAAYIFLEVDPALVAVAPKVSHLFKHVPGGEPAIWEMLSGSDSADAAKLLQVKERLTNRQFNTVPFEAIAIAAGMSTKHAFGVVSEAVIEHSQDASKLILHASAPAMMEKAVEHAKADGVGERKTLLQAVGLVPRSRNTVTIVNGDVVKGNKQTLAVLPSVSDAGRRFGQRFGMEMTLPAIAAPADETDRVHDAEFVDEEGEYDSHG